jgi:hypothetical protein
MGELAYIPS